MTLIDGSRRFCYIYLLKSKEQLCTTLRSIKLKQKVNLRGRSNGVAQRKNHTIIDLVNIMLDTAGLSKEQWGEAILISYHALNHVLTKNKEITSFKESEKKISILSYLWTWGCLAKVDVLVTKKCKLGAKTVDCIFLHHYPALGIYF